MKSNNVIEINGKLYDARSGAPLSNLKRAAKPSAAKTTKNNKTPIKVVDGFTKPSAKTRSPVAPKKSEVKTAPAAATSRPASNRAKLHAKRSTTLNRTVVTAPKINAVVPLEQPSAQIETISSGALKQSDSKRLKRAQQITKSGAISRFGQPGLTSSKKEAGAPLTTHLSQTHGRPEKDPRPQPAPLSTKEQLIKKAIKGASLPDNTKPVPSAHKKQRAKKSHVGRYASTAVAAFLLAGYVAYLNVPSISMKVAAHRAGFAATLPTYKPAGYSLKGPIAYSPGQVSLNFASNTDERKFVLKQQPTTWDSTALLENYVTKQTSDYLTYQDRGLTIYIFDGSNAAWVSGGKMYQLEGGSSLLDTEQLLKLATSV